MRNNIVSSMNCKIEHYKIAQSSNRPIAQSPNPFPTPYSPPVLNFMQLTNISAGGDIVCKSSCRFYKY